MSVIPEKTWRAGRFWWDSSRPSEPDRQPLRALIFDLDALADVEGGGHRCAFNAAFAAHGLPLHWTAARYRKLLALRDERQRVAAELRARGVCTECDVLARVLIDDVCATKAMLVDETMLGVDLDPRPGLVELITEAYTAGVAVGVVADGRRAWVQPLVRQLVGDGLVDTIVTTDDVTAPADAYRLALAELGAPAHDTLAFVGTGTGVRTALTVGLAAEFVGPEARADYDGLRLADCRRLQGRFAASGRSAAA